MAAGLEETTLVPLGPIVCGASQGGIQDLYTDTQASLLMNTL